MHILPCSFSTLALFHNVRICVKTLPLEAVETIGISRIKTTEVFLRFVVITRAFIKHEN